MTAHEYPLVPVQRSERTPPRADQYAAKHWSDLRLDWLRARMEAPCSSN